MIESALIRQFTAKHLESSIVLEDRASHILDEAKEVQTALTEYLALDKDVAIGVSLIKELSDTITACIVTLQLLGLSDTQISQSIQAVAISNMTKSHSSVANKPLKESEFVNAEQLISIILGKTE